MNWEMIESNWTIFIIMIHLYWGKVTLERLALIKGDREHLIRQIEITYKINHSEAKSQLSRWQKNLINIDGHFYHVKNHQVEP
jgi:predicted Ser/Thr protein kinase